MTRDLIFLVIINLNSQFSNLKSLEVHAQAHRVASGRLQASLAAGGVARLRVDIKAVACPRPEVVDLCTESQALQVEFPTDLLRKLVAEDEGAQFHVIGRHDAGVEIVVAAHHVGRAGVAVGGIIVLSSIRS